MLKLAIYILIIESPIRPILYPNDNNYIFIQIPNCIPNPTSMTFETPQIIKTKAPHNIWLCQWHYKGFFFFLKYIRCAQLTDVTTDAQKSMIDVWQRTGPECDSLHTFLLMLQALHKALLFGRVGVDSVEYEVRFCDTCRGTSKRGTKLETTVLCS